ncbi:DUF2971 domain-containing protein [Ornithobacterium rhinotracheale]|uniref:DUF2971 domain-containing protein n=1 Tax=Ornithobacterium rhinotracheale TaxID=28251 RepID=UPI00129D1F1F|nr:DUF2971 domain-containing protein [Ornithobacterium rhinotracheale]MRJ07904.1 DUF2971 domain-containing protein [Ornithobacterium rhinotracheale]UOH78582.1 DUF2971 domain-containing protein [Ornithobacterium rhinotracheale]
MTLIFVADRDNHMYQSHPNCIQPDNEYIYVWRYLDLKKFLSFVQTRSLFFCALNNFEDNFEGSIPRNNILRRTDLLKNIPKNKHEFYLNGLMKFKELHKMFREMIYVNCWHSNQNESIAMWKIYSRNDEGVAIRSTYKQLKESIEDEKRIFMGIVKYIDYDKDIIDDSNALSSVFHKRLEYSFENEVRLVTDGLNERTFQKSIENKALGVATWIN